VEKVLLFIFEEPDAEVGLLNGFPDALIPLTIPIEYTFKNLWINGKSSGAGNLC